MTLGESGALIVTENSSIRVPALRLVAVDTTGAGDAFNAGPAMALACGASVEAAVQFAVVTGGLAVTKEGVIPALPNRDEVRRAYRLQNLTAPLLEGARMAVASRLLPTGKDSSLPYTAIADTE